MTTNIKEQIFDKSALYSTPNGRDYLKTPDGEVFSINGLYCDQEGNQNRWGTRVKIMDIRWDVVVLQDCVIGMNEDYTYKTEKRLIFRGDDKDQGILAHYGYRVERDDKGYKNVLPLGKPMCSCGHAIADHIWHAYRNSPGSYRCTKVGCACKSAQEVK